MIATRCRCGEAYDVPEGLAGQKFKCKKCGGKVRVPAAGEAAEGKQKRPKSASAKDAKEAPSKRDSAKAKAKRDSAKEKREGSARTKRDSAKVPKREPSARGRRGSRREAADDEEGRPRRPPARSGVNPLFFVGGIGIVAALAFVFVFLGGDDSGRDLPPAALGWYKQVNTQIEEAREYSKNGDVVNAEASFMGALKSLEADGYPLAECPAQFAALKGADVASLKAECQTLADVAALIAGVGEGNEGAITKAIAQAGAGEEWKRLAALNAMATRYKEPRFERAIVDVAKTGTGAVQARALELLKTKFFCAESIPVLVKDLDGSDWEYAAKTLARNFTDTAIAEPLAKFLAKRPGDSELHQEILGTLQELETKKLLPVSVIPDLEKFGAKMKGKDVSVVALELVKCLRGEKDEEPSATPSETPVPGPGEDE